MFASRARSCVVLAQLPPREDRATTAMRKIALADGELQPLFGVHDENLQHLESALDIKVSARDREVFLEGEEAGVEIAAKP